MLALFTRNFLSLSWKITNQFTYTEKNSFFMIYISGIFLLNTTTTTTHTFLLASQNVWFLNDFTIQYREKAQVVEKIRWVTSRQVSSKNFLHWMQRRMPQADLKVSLDEQIRQYCRIGWNATLSPHRKQP